MANIRDVAKVANVSISTVSSVLSGKKAVSPQLRGRVLSAVAQLGYQTSGQEQRCGLGAAREVGVILPGLYSSFFPPMLSGLSDAAQEIGCTMVLCDSGRDWRREKECLQVLIERGVRNIIVDSLCPAEREEEYFTGIKRELIDKMGICVVVLERKVKIEGFCSIYVDNYHAGYEATAHLIKIGRRRIAHIQGSPLFPNSKYRERGYRMALLDAGLPFDPHLILPGDFSPLSGFSAVNELFAKGIDFDGLFSANDQMAIGAIKALSQQGLEIPGDVAIVGFDNLFVSSLVQPGVSTMQFPIYQMGYLAVGAVKDMRAGRQAQRYTSMPARLIVRQSSDPSQASDWALQKW